jgi:hypothetical protein
MTGCRGALPLLVLAVVVAVPAAAQLDGKDIKIGIGGPLTTTSAGFGVEMKQGWNSPSMNATTRVASRAPKSLQLP